MSFTKKQKYFSGYLKSIERKVSYTEPIFLVDVQFNDDASIYSEHKGGAEDNLLDGQYLIPLPMKITKSKELLLNISQFTDLEKSKKTIGVLMRNIVLGKSLPNVVSIYDKIMEIYKILFETYDIKKYETVDFPIDPFSAVDELIKKNTHNIAVIDFDARSQKDADIIAAIKQIFFDHKSGDLICASRSTMIEYMKKKKYKVSVAGKLTYNMIEPYCLMFIKAP